MLSLFTAYEHNAQSVTELQEGSLIGLKQVHNRTMTLLVVYLGFFIHIFTEYQPVYQPM